MTAQDDHDLAVSKCQQCLEKPSITRLRVGDVTVPVCEYCLVELLHIIDAALTSWTRRTGNTLQSLAGGEEEKSARELWAEDGIIIPASVTKGFVSTNCPMCNKDGEPLVVSLDAGTAECRACGAAYAIG